MGFEDMAKTGVANHYGPRSTNEKFGGQTSSSSGIVKSAIWQFKYNDLPNHTGAATSVVAATMQESIPAGATIVSAKLFVDAAFTSSSTTTDLLIGLANSAGTEIDLDGLLAATDATQTAIGTAGNVVTGAGALVGKTIGAAAGYLVVGPNVNDLTAGAGRVVVEYVYDR